MITLRDVSKIYRSGDREIKALDNVSFSDKKGRKGSLKRG